MDSFASPAQLGRAQYGAQPTGAGASVNGYGAYQQQQQAGMYGVNPAAAAFTGLDTGSAGVSALAPANGTGLGMTGGMGMRFPTVSTT